MKFYSFFKVGGGFRSEDYDKILHLTAGKWVDWNAKDTMD
jgi:DNA ligase-4